MYVNPNFGTKKALKEAVAKGDRVTVFHPGLFNEFRPRNGVCCVSGPHFPQAHSWYATITIKHGYVTEVK